MADDKICLKLPPEMRVQLIEICHAHGISMSECMRAMIHGAISGVGALGGVDAGFLEGRGQMRIIVHNLLREAEANLPATFAEAVARYGFEQP